MFLISHPPHADEDHFEEKRFMMNLLAADLKDIVWLSLSSIYFFTLNHTVLVFHFKAFISQLYIFLQRV